MLFRDEDKMINLDGDIKSSEQVLLPRYVLSLEGGAQESVTSRFKDKTNMEKI